MKFMGMQGGQRKFQRDLPKIKESKEMKVNDVSSEEELMEGSSEENLLEDKSEKQTKKKGNIDFILKDNNMTLTAQL